MDRNELLGVVAVSKAPVPVEGLDGVFVRQGDHPFRMESSRMHAFGRKQDADRLLVARLLVDADGKRIFDDDADPGIDSISAEWSSRIFAAYLKANVTSEETIDELEKNSEADRN